VAEARVTTGDVEKEKRAYGTSKKTNERRAFETVRGERK
jgi:hypothetical protein